MPRRASAGRQARKEKREDLVVSSKLRSDEIRENASRAKPTLISFDADRDKIYDKKTTGDENVGGDKKKNGRRRARSVDSEAREVRPAKSGIVKRSEVDNDESSHEDPPVRKPAKRGRFSDMLTRDTTVEEKKS